MGEDLSFNLWLLKAVVTKLAPYPAITAPNPRDLLAECAQLCLPLKYGQESASFKGCLPSRGQVV